MFSKKSNNYSAQAESKRSRQKSKRRRKATESGVGYSHLESRCLLATVAMFDAATGSISISMDAPGDQAIVDVSNGLITVNGSSQFGDGAGATTVALSEANSIDVTGNGLSDTTAELKGDFSSSAASLNSITLTGVDVVRPLGEFNLESLTAVGVNVISATLSNEISVSGDINIDVGESFYSRANLSVGGSTNISSGGDLHLENFSSTNSDTATLTAANNLLLGDIAVVGNLTAVALGSMSNAADAEISVAENAFLTADSINLGNQSGDNVQFERTSITATGDVNLNQDNKVRLLNTTAANLTVSSPSQISNGATSNISIEGDASFAAPRVLIGNQADDSFDAGRLNVNSTAVAVIEESGDTEMFGANVGGVSFTIQSDGALTDSSATTITVANLARLQGSSISLGDRGVFTSRLTEFNSAGDVDVAQQSVVRLFGSNTAANLRLTSTDRIVDNHLVTTNVTFNSTFVAPLVILGDSAKDEFNTGSLTLTASSYASVSEDSDTVILGDNLAGGLSLESVGAIQNGAGTSLTTTGRTTLTGTRINLGDSADDSVELRTLTFNSSGEVTIAQEGRAFLFGDNTADSLELSADNIVDGNLASLTVNGNAKFAAPNIRIGDSATDSLTAATYTFESTGAVVAKADGNLILHGDSHALSMSLESSSLIGDSPSSTTDVTGKLTVTAASVHLGGSLDAESNRQLNFRRLTANTSGTTNITSGKSFSLVGANHIGDQLVLQSDGDITDDPTAQTRVESFVSFTANDVVIGELGSDCFDIIAGIDQLLVDAAGVANVQSGCVADFF